MTTQPIVVDTPNAIAKYRLCAIRARIKMEAKGLKFRGGSTRTHVAAELGLKPRDTHQKFVDKLTEMIDAP